MPPGNVPPVLARALSGAGGKLPFVFARIVIAGVLGGVLLVAALAVAAQRPFESAAVTRVTVPAPAHLDAGTRAADPLVTAASVRGARRWAQTRAGEVAFAVLDGTRVRGWAHEVQMPSASISKAMLLVAVLRRERDRPLGASLRRLLEPMITWSDNDAAGVVYAQVGGAGLGEVARAAGMTHFADVGDWAAARVTAADQARLFFALDRLVPRRHRPYARQLLGSIVPAQSWGIPAVARGRGLHAWFKGGWRSEVVHQAALVEGRGRRVAIAVLTRGSPGFGYAVATVEGITRRLLAVRR
jgi:beta-lactamase family protein